MTLLGVRAALQGPGETSCPVDGPTFSAQRISRDCDHSACARLGAGHVLGPGRRLWVVAPPVRRHARVAVEDLDRVGRVADLDLLAEQLVRHAADVALDLDVVVDVTRHSFQCVMTKRAASRGRSAGRLSCS